MQPHFFVHFLGVVLHDYNFQKLPSYTYFQRKYFIYSCSLFPTAAHFYLVAASISHFLTATIIFSCFSSNKISLHCFYFLLWLFLVIIHIKVGIKIQSKEKLGFVLVFSLEKSWWSCDLPPKFAGCLKCKISPQIICGGRRTYRHMSYG